MSAKQIKVPKIPRGWRELRAGSFIRHGDRYWSWNVGPWVEEENFCTRKYRPCDRFTTESGKETHWIHIRRIKTLPKKRASK